MKEKKVKTNAIRIIENNKLNYKAYTYEGDGFMSGVEVAKLINREENRVFKTLVTISNTGGYYVCMIPVHRELDLKKAAKAHGVKKLEMLPSKDITKITGYVKGGCSPIGMKKAFDTVIDTSAENLDSIIFSGGKRGLQVELSLQDLNSLIKFTYEDITKMF